MQIFIPVNFEAYKLYCRTKNMADQWFYSLNDPADRILIISQ